MNLKLTLEYDGTEFCGWQVQPGQRTVQGVLEDAILRLTGREVRIHGSGRTDAGVHATAQVASFRLDTTIPPERFKHALNPLLPQDVKVISSEEVADDFHARFSAKGKTYAYHLLLRDVPSPLSRHRAWLVGAKLDIERMQTGLKLVQGTHDFKAFSATGSSVASTERTIYEASLTSKGCYIVITLHGNGFLYNMVRIIVSAIVSLGQGRLSPEQVTAALVSGDRSMLPSTAPAHGLYLIAVDY